MSSVMPPMNSGKNSEQNFYDSQKMASTKRGMTFEALFYRHSLPIEPICCLFHQDNLFEKDCPFILL